jgi:acetyl-CoA C-acetyltransferase/3-oxo-5,6-didehydrosuberyl-CoA/3-oxoadipyl-CoA thiolase
MADSTVGWRFTNPRMKKEWTISLGETAEKVASQYGVSRAEQDAFAVESQARAQKALAAGVFADELVPVPLPGKENAGKSFMTDEHPRAGVTLESLAKMKPAFVTDGTVTAASSSGINDGAAAMTVVSGDAMRELELKPMARIISSAVAGVDPSIMGIGPVPAVRKALARAGIKASDLDLVELNEAFAAQAIPCIRELGLDPAKVNIYGGAIALGHPLGASGAKILTTLVHALRRTGGRYGVASMCIGVGQGIALVVESVKE